MLPRGLRKIFLRMRIAIWNTAPSPKTVSILLHVSSPDANVCATVLIDTYLNGPRTLSNSRLSYLIVSHKEESGLLTPPETPTPSNENTPFVSSQDSTSRIVQDPQHELLICAMHFLGDGMALHNFANEFFGLLGSDKDETSLREILDEEWTLRWADGKINDVSSR